jgi:phosphoribosylglycinamide formyltransferase-1
MRVHIAIFASGTGSNAKKIIDYFKHDSQIAVSLIVSNNLTAPVLDIGRQKGIPTHVLRREEFYKTENILEIFNKYSIDFVVLAGFLWLVPAYLVHTFWHRMLNIHPALLPKYGGKGMYGMRVHEAVIKNGEDESGITIHYVNEQYDEGDIVFQAKCKVTQDDTPESLANKIHQLEHRFFPEIIQQQILKIL